MTKTIEINKDFKEALDLIASGRHVFITGKAGTGKSTLLTYFRAHTDKKSAFLAPTGVAALNIAGQTIHSFFGFKPDITVSKVKKEYRNRDKKGLYKNLDTIVIDEISMVRADVLDCVDEFLRLNGKDKTKPFGGVQMVFFGDLYQLPPVVPSGEKELFANFYETPYFFSAKAFGKIEFDLLELEKIYRQKDEIFIRLLNAVRNRSIDENLLSILNSRVNVSFRPQTDDFYVYLTTTNAKAFQINISCLEKLSSKQFANTGIVRGNFDVKVLPTDRELLVKKGAQIMFVNNDREGRWVNGTMGKVVDIEKEEDEHVIFVELADGDIVDVTLHTWEMFRFVYNNSFNRLESEIVGSFIQYPLMLAWAITIHKSQGKTFEKVIIDMDRGAFAHGQTYVALSRCTNLEGIVLMRPITKGHILLDWKVVKFLTEFQYKKSEQKMGFSDKSLLIEKAIKDKKKLEMVYLKSNDERSKRTVIPEKLAEMEYMGKSFLGVEGYDFLRKDERVFRVDRILELKIV